MKWIEVYLHKGDWDFENRNYDYLNEPMFSKSIEICKHCGSEVIIYTAYGTKHCAVCKKEVK